MNGPPKRYCGDKRMTKHLRDISSPLSIHQVYGLFYGCLAAPRLVRPSEYMPWILGEEEAFESLERANKFVSDLMGLWNHLASCYADGHPARFPALEPPVSNDDLKSYIEHRSALVTYFTKGLDLGGTDESDFTPDGLEALEDLATSTGFLEAHLEIQARQPLSREEIRAAYDNVGKLELIIADCIARVSMGLKPARMRLVQDLARSQSATPPPQSPKIARNDPCPCGSGKKYKRCCGLRH